MGKIEVKHDWNFGGDPLKDIERAKRLEQESFNQPLPVLVVPVWLARKLSRRYDIEPFEHGKEE